MSRSLHPFRNLVPSIAWYFATLLAGGMVSDAWAESDLDQLLSQVDTVIDEGGELDTNVVGPPDLDAVAVFDRRVLLEPIDTAEMREWGVQSLIPTFRNHQVSGSYVQAARYIRYTDDDSVDRIDFHGLNVTFDSFSRFAAHDQWGWGASATLLEGKHKFGPIRPNPLFSPFSADYLETKRFEHQVAMIDPRLIHRTSDPKGNLDLHVGLLASGNREQVRFFLEAVNGNTYLSREYDAENWMFGPSAGVQRNWMIGEQLELGVQANVGALYNYAKHDQPTLIYEGRTIDGYNEGFHYFSWLGDGGLRIGWRFSENVRIQALLQHTSISKQRSLITSPKATRFRFTSLELGATLRF